MALEPLRITWSEEAFSTFRALPSGYREQISRRIGLLKNHPRMYPTELAGRWAGLRRFHSVGWIVFYAYWQAENAIYVNVIVPERTDYTEID